MISEKTYWAILIVGFTCFSLLIWLCIIPFQLLEYNLSVNLLTSSIFTVLTIILLTWIISIQQTQRWKRVKSAVYREIGVALGHLFRTMIIYYKNGFIDWYSLNRLKPESEKAFELASFN